MKKIVICVLALILLSCKGNYVESPLDQFIRDFEAEPTYTVILYDMDVQGTFVKRHMHQYKIITEKNGVPEQKVTERYQVSKNFFWKNENNVGMELVSKTADGKIHKTPAPAGFSNYIGNEKYGQWRRRNDGTSFWAFYGQFAFMSTMFNLFAHPVNGRYYNGYYNNYRYRRPYYGPTVGGKPTYGTYGNVNKNSRSSSFQRRMSGIKQKSSNFKQRVTNRVNRSAGRYKTGSGMRSRSGGFGK